MHLCQVSDPVQHHGLHNQKFTMIAHGIKMTVFVAFFLSCPSIFSTTSENAQADAPDLTEAIVRRANQVERAYRQVWASGRETYRNAEGVRRELLTTYARDGDQAFVRQHWVVSDVETWPGGSELLAGGTRQEMFRLIKGPEEEQFTLQSLRPTADFDLHFLNDARPIYVPFSVWGYTLEEFLDDAATEIVNIDDVALDGHAVVRLTTDVRAQDPTEPSRVRRYLYFLPEDLRIIGFTQFNNPDDPDAVFTEFRITYEPDTEPPVIREFRAWDVHPTQPDREPRPSVWEITDLKFGPPPQEIFDLATYGIEEPVFEAVPVSDRGNVVAGAWRPWAGVSAGLLLVVGLVLWILSRRSGSAA